MRTSPNHPSLIGTLAASAWLCLFALTPCVAGEPSPSAAAEALAANRFSTLAVGPVAAPWRVVGLPGQKVALTRFSIIPDRAAPVLQLQSDAAYANLVLDLAGAHLPPAAQLRWRWQLAQAPEGADLRRKEGDDAPLKVCALFDMPLQGMAFGEQTRLRIARALSGEALPSATLCYVWDRQLPVGTTLPNVFSARVRYLVATQGPARPGRWRDVSRDLSADFLRAFGHETAVVPPLLGLAVGADTDNTGSTSLAYVGDLSLTVP